MVYSKAPIPFSRGSVKPRVFLQNIVPDTLEPLLEDTHKTLVFEALRHQISGGANIEDILESAASGARELTAASGAAVAMGVDENVVCVGRSGETAPPLGAQVSVESGLSGECMRSGKPILCDDTQLDARVDPEVCLSLGLRSLAAVSLRAPGDAVGLLEVFSNYPNNFLPHHLDILRGLGDLVELAYSRVSPKALPVPLSPEEELKVQASIAEVEASLSEPRAIEWLRDSHSESEKKKFPYWAIPVALILVLLCFRGWSAWHDSTRAVTAPAPVDTEDVIEADIAIPKPNPARDTRRKAPKPDDGGAPALEAADVVVRKFPKEATPEAPRSATEETSEPPQLPVMSENTELLKDLVKRDAPMPAAESIKMVSQGVTRGNVIHRVPPAYPADAISQGLSGSVVLKATIDEKGNVAEVSTLSGMPALARAAETAVKQWRYEPSLLNGIPVRVETEITVNFKKP